MSPVDFRIERAGQLGPWGNQMSQVAEQMLAKRGPERIMEGPTGGVIAAVYLQHGYVVERFPAPRTEPSNPWRSYGSPWKWNARPRA